MNNNKGQVLVLFILILPIIIMSVALVVDLGLLLNETYKVKSNIKEVIHYGLNSNEDNKKEIMGTLLDTNLKDIDIKSYNIDTTNDIIVTVNGTYNSIFKGVFKNADYKYSFTYDGYLENNKEVIKEK